MNARLVLFVVLLAAAMAVGIVLVRSEDAADPTNPAESSGSVPDNGELLVGRETPALQGSGEAPDASQAKSAQRTLAGRVVEARSGDPIEAAMVVAWRADGQPGYSVVFSDEDGGFSVEDLTPGPWWLVAWHPLYVPAGLAELMASKEDDPLPDALTLSVPTEGGPLPDRIIVLKAGRRIHGRVIDERDQPVGLARIRPKRAKWMRAIGKRLGIGRVDPDEFPVFANQEGRFAFACLPAGIESVQLGASKAGYAGRWCEAFSTDPDTGDLELTLRLVHTATVEGTVRLPDGSPAAGTYVDLDDYDRELIFDKPDDVLVGPDGSFKLVGVPPGDIELGPFWRDPFLVPDAGHDVTDLLPDETRSGVELTIPTRYALRVRLRLPNGEPQHGETVVVFDDRQPPDEKEIASKRTNEHGRLAVSLPSPGPYDVIQVLAGGRHVLARAVLLPAEELELVSAGSPWHEFDIRVLGPDDKPVETFSSRVSLAGERDPDEELRSMESGEEGVAHHRIAGPPPYRLTIEPAIYKSDKEFGFAHADEFVSELPPERVVAVRLRPYSLLYGRVTAADGSKVTGVRIELRKQGDGKATIRVPVAADGTFEHAVPPTKEFFGWFVHVVAPAHFVHVDSRMFQPERPRHDFVLVRGGSVSGRLVMPATVRLEGKKLVRVSWRDDEDHYQCTESQPVDAGGRFDIGGVPEDRKLTLEFQSQDLRALGLQSPKTVEGLRAGAKGLEIALEFGVSLRGRVDWPSRPDANFLLLLHSLSDPAVVAHKERKTGVFEMGGLTPGRYRLLLIGQGGRPTSLVLARQIVDTATPVTIRIGPAGDIRLRLSEERDFPELTAWRAGTTYSAASGGAGKDAAYTMSSLPSAYRYDIVVDGYGLMGRAANVGVGDEATIELVEPVDLVGTLTTKRPLARSDLYARGDGCCFDLLVGEQGEFEAQVLPGRYDIVLVDLDGTRHVVATDVEAGGKALALALK